MEKNRIESIIKYPGERFCVRYTSGAHHSYNGADLPKTASRFWESASIRSEGWSENFGVFEYASVLSEDAPKVKPEVFYTGGGIWLSAVYLDENVYVATDNCDVEDGFYIYDHRNEDDWSEFPCQNCTDGKNVEVMNHEELQLYNVLRDALLREMN